MKKSRINLPRAVGHSSAVSRGSENVGTSKERIEDQWFGQLGIDG